MGWLSGWHYRKSHVLNSATGAGTNYQIRVKAHYPDKVFSLVWNSGTIATGTSNDSGRNMLRDGNYLYGVSCTPQKLVIYDISNPSSPVQKSLTSLGYNGIDVRKKDNYLFISCSNGVQVWDVSNPNSPSLTTTIFNDGAYVHGMYLSGNYLYCCRHTLNKFVIVDVTNPASPVVKGSVSGSTYFHGAHDVYVDDTTHLAYVTNYLAAIGEYGLTVVDVSDVDSPTVVTGTDENHKNSHIIRMGNYLYVGSHPPDYGISVWNISTPSSPTYVGRFFTDIESCGYWMDDYDSNTIAVVCERGYPGLILVDISNPSSLRKIGVLGESSVTFSNVVFTDGYFYLSARGSGYAWSIRSYTLQTATDSGEDVYLNLHSREDFGDVRFTDDDGTTLLDYWMEEKVDSDYAIFWVKVADDLSTNPATIYIYYGKSDATTTSNGDNTFLFFDDFESGTFGKWNTYGSWTIVSDVVKQGSKAAYHTGGGSTRVLEKTLPNTYDNVMIHLWARVSQAIDYSGYPIIPKDPNDVLVYSMAFMVSAIKYYQTGYYAWPQNNTYSANTWYRLECGYRCSANSQDGFKNRASMGSIQAKNANGNQISGIKSVTIIASPDAGKNMWIDVVYLRKYVSPEPSHASWGSEEQVSGGQTYEIYVNAVSQSLTTPAYEATYNIMKNADVSSQSLTTSETTFNISKDAIVNVLADMLVEVVTGVIEIFKEALTTAQTLCQTETAFNISRDALAHALTQTLFELGVAKEVVVKASTTNAFEVAFTLPLDAIVKADALSILESTFRISQEASIKVFAEVAVLKPTEVKITRLFLVLGDLAIQIQGN